MAQTYSFPILADQELLPCLKEMELPLTAAQISKPSYEFVRPVYESIVYSLMGITREELQQPVFSAIDTLEFPELHDESIPFLAFMKHLTRLMTSAGVRDFSLQDLCKPESIRLRRNLSAVINFAKFREEKLAPYTEMQEEANSLLEATDQLEQAKAQSAEQLRRLQESRAAERPAVEEREAASKESYARNQQLNKQQMELNTEVRALKNQTNTLAAQSADIKLRLQTTKQRIDRTRAQIVESPEKLEAALKELQQAVERERALTTETERRARDLQTKLDTLSRIDKERQKSMGMIEDAAAELSRKKAASQKAKALQAEIRSQETDAAQLAAEHSHLQRQISSLKERLQRLENQCELRKEAALSAVEEQRTCRDAIEAENAANIAKLAEDEAAMRSIRERINELQSAHGTEVGTALEKFQAVRRQAFLYHESLDAAMGLSDFTGTLSSVVKPPR